VTDERAHVLRIDTPEERERGFRAAPSDTQA
jgi:hypothetical protein